MRLLGSVAFVTGAAQGLGKAFSESLLKRGAQVCLSDVQVTKGKDVEREFKRKYGNDKVIFVECNVKSKESFSEAFRKAKSAFGSIDLLINNAGISNESIGQEMININLTGTVIGTDLAVEHMRKDKNGKGGTIINIASTAGIIPIYLAPVYTASKFGVLGYTSAWANNPYADAMGMQFACLCPSFAQTAIIDFREGRSLYPEDGKRFLKAIGIQSVDDVAKALLSILDKDECNGDIVTVTAKDGIQFKKARNMTTMTSKV